MADDATRQMAEQPQQRRAPRRRREPREKVVYAEWLNTDMRMFLLSPTDCMSDELNRIRWVVIKRRTHAMMATSMELLAAVVCMASYVGRPSWMVLAVSALQVCFAGVGLMGAMKLNGCQIAVHIMLLGGLTAAYALAQIVMAMVVSSCEAIAMILACLSLIILCCLVLSVLLGIAVLKLQAAREEDSNSSGSEESSSDMDSEDIVRQASEMLEVNRCCVCMDRPKNAVFTPCGHKAVCLECGERLRARGIRCPICRQLTSGVVRVYDS